jgi:hypothetical protein
MRVDVLNQYFRDGKCAGLALVPTARTRELLAAARMRAKQVENTLLIIAETNAEGRPPVRPDPAMRLTFYLDLLDPVVLTVSNVDLDELRTARFHFNNLADNATGAADDVALHLSRPLPAYDDAREYLPGALVSKSGEAFECLSVSTGHDPEAPDTTFWVTKGAASFVSNEDLVEVRPAVSRFRLQAKAAAFRIKVFGLDAAGDYAKLLHESFVSQAPSDSTDEVLVDLSRLPPTRYRVEINGETFEAFFDDEAKARNPLGIVELFHDLEATDAYSPVDEAGVLREVKYTIAFANRHAHWKYLTPRRKVKDILVSEEPPGSSPFTAAADKDFFQSKLPLGLSQSPRENAFDLILDGETRPAPRPDPRMPGVFSFNRDEESGTWREPVFNIRLNL